MYNRTKIHPYNENDNTTSSTSLRSSDSDDNNNNNDNDNNSSSNNGSSKGNNHTVVSKRISLKRSPVLSCCLSLKLVLIVNTLVIVLTLGIFLMVMFTVISYLGMKTNISVVVDKATHEIENVLYGNLITVLEGSMYFRNLLTKYECEQADTEYCITKKIDTQINVLNQEMGFMRDATVYLRTHRLLYGKYAELSKDVILCNFDEHTDIITYMSQNSDGSMYTSDVGFDPTKANFTLFLPPGRYDILEKEWYIETASSGKSDWAMYFSGDKVKAISYSHPIFFKNKTLKGMVNVCMENMVTNEVLEELSKYATCDILLMDKDNNIISTTFTNTNVSKLEYNERKGRWSDVPLNITESENALFAPAYDLAYLDEEVRGTRIYTSSRIIKCDDFKSINSTNLKYCLFFDRSELEQNTLLTVLIGISGISGVLIATIVIMIPLTSIIISAVTKPIDKLMEKLKAGKFEKLSITSVIPFEFLKIVTTLKEIYERYGVFTDYLQEDVVNSVMAGKKLGSEQTNVCVIFIDLVGYTKKTQHMKAGAITKMLNRFSRCIYDYIPEDCRHIIKFDKIIGDCVMYYCKDTGINVNILIQWAINLHEKCDSFKFRMGASYGPCYLGYVGFPLKQLTVIGKEVNVASRLESLGKTLESNFLISEDLFCAMSTGLKDRFEIKEESHEIRGIEEKRTIYSYTMKKKIEPPPYVNECRPLRLHVVE